MPRLRQPQASREPTMVLSPAPGSEIQRAILYSTASGRFNKAAWMQTGAGVTLLQAIHQTPLAAPISHFQKHSPLKKLLPSDIGTRPASR